MHDTYPRSQSHLNSSTPTGREDVVRQGDHIVRLLQDRLTETAAADGDPEAFLRLPTSREAVRQGVAVLDKGHDDSLGGWQGGRGGMKFPQVRMYAPFIRRSMKEDSGKEERILIRYIEAFFQSRRKTVLAVEFRRFL